MATATESAPVLSPIEEDRIVDLTSDEFFRMIEAGVFAPERRVYLWGGRLIEKMAKTKAHFTSAVRILDAFRTRLPVGWLMSPENPVQLDAKHAPLPDIAVIRGPVEVYEKEDRYTIVGDVGLIVEVAVTSLPKDLGARAEVFARALIPTYWVADVLGRKLIEHRGPRVVEGVGSYEHVRTLGRDDEVSLTFDGREVGPIPVRELLA
jgi:Uma2 family endonuclease